jgi:Sec-independent protein translocase protein TatA
MSATALGRGPLTFLLQSSGTQWVFIGAIGLGIFGTDRVRSVLQESIAKALQLSQSPHNQHGGRLAEQGGGSSRNMPPIVIHTGSNSSGGGLGLSSAGGIVGLALQVTLGAVTCWAAYGVISNASFIPDIVKEVLPVSRKLFDRAVKSLGEGIIHVRDSLSEQMKELSQTQEELSSKQDKTLSEIELVKCDVGDARQDLERMIDSLTRCESSLGSTEHVSNYTAKGVRLLVRCVAGMLPGNDRVLTELVQYIKESDNLASKGDTPPSLPPKAPALQYPQSTPEDEHPTQIYTITGNNTPMRSQPPRPQPPSEDHLHEIHSLLGFVNCSPMVTPMKA